MDRRRERPIKLISTTNDTLSKVFLIYSKSIMAQQRKKNKRRIDYKVIPLASKYAKEARDILIDGFAGRSEPLCKGMNQYEFGLLMDIVLNISTVYKTSLVAVEKKSNKVIGTVICNDMLYYNDIQLLKLVPAIILKVVMLIASRYWKLMLTSTSMIMAIICMSVVASRYNMEIISNEVYYVGFATLAAFIYQQSKESDEAEDTRFNLMRLFDPEIVNELVKQWKAERKEQNELKIGQILECQLTAVHADYLHCGVGTALKKKMIAIAKEHKYKYIVSEATNDYSQGQNKKIGFKVEKKIDYKTFECPKESGKYPWKAVSDETGFTKLCLMVYTLK